jgi:predicted nucleotidyltransferase component of viral defense system
MMISKERLGKEKNRTGYRQEVIEKVIWLIQVLTAVSEDSYLKSRLVLKGGTALNLFYFDLPRLSVDADFNYIGTQDREGMLKERPELEKRLTKLLQRLGLNLIRNPQVHAGGKMTWRYPSALGNQGTVEIDLNYMYRTPLLPPAFKQSIMLADQQVSELLLLDLHELAAGKLTALIDREAGRDIFDAFHLFSHPELDVKKLRLLFVVYAAMSHKKNYLTISIDQIIADPENLKNKLLPVLKNNYHQDFPSMKAWINHLTHSVQSHFKKLLPFTEKEKDFIQSIQQQGVINPELITSDPVMASRINSHSALLWACKKHKKC